MAQRYRVKEKTVKQNTIVEDVDYIPDPSDDTTKLLELLFPKM